MGKLQPRKKGRPIVGESRKDLRLQLRLNHEEMQLIDECTKRTNQTRVETVMQGIRLLKNDLDAKKTER